MNIPILVVTVILGALAGVAVWEVLLKKAGGVVYLDPNSWLMRRWKRELEVRGEKYRDPINLCQLFHYIFGVARVGRAYGGVIEKVVDVTESERKISQWAAKGTLGFMVVLGVIEGVLIFGVLPAFTVFTVVERGLANSVPPIIVTVSAIGIGCLFLWWIREGSSWRAFIAKMMVVWTKACPPVVVRRQENKNCLAQ